jgi:hypothetical protein
MESIVAPRPAVSNLAIRAALLAVLAAALIAPSKSRAAEYTVHSCRTPDGRPAGLDGWTRTVAGRENLSANYCGRGGYWILFMRGIVSHAPGELNEAVFTAPEGTTISGYEIWRSVRILRSNGFNYSYVLLQGGRQAAVERCYGILGCGGLGTSKQPLAASNRVSRSGLEGVGRLWLSLGCRSSTTCATLSTDSPAKLYIHRSSIRLEDASSPVISSAPSGTLVTDKALAGVEHVSLSASDRGGGVYRAMAEIDGKIVASQVLDSNGGRCQPPFTFVRPCKESASGTLAVDTAGVPDGKHLLRLLVTDATETNVGAWGPTAIRTSNGSCRIKPRSRELRMGGGILPGRRGRLAAAASSVTVPYGRRLKLLGRLTAPSGTPVADAPVCVASRAQMRGAALRAEGELRTDGRGRVAYQIQRGPSRIVYLVHRTPSGAVVKGVRVNVRAPVRLQGSTRLLRNGDTLVLRGALLARPRPSGGAIVELQARREDGWQTFGTARSGRNGRFRFAYTFTRTFGVRSYALRARVPAQANYPYAPGVSKPVLVQVRG